MYIYIHVACWNINTMIPNGHVKVSFLMDLGLKKKFTVC